MAGRKYSALLSLLRNALFIPDDSSVTEVIGRALEFALYSPMISPSRLEYPF